MENFFRLPYYVNINNNKYSKNIIGGILLNKVIKY